MMKYKKFISAKTTSKHCSILIHSIRHLSKCCFFLKDKSKKKMKGFEESVLTHVDNRTATWSKRHEMLHAFGWGWSFFIQVSQTSGHHNDHSVFGPLVSRRDPWIWKRVKNNNNNKERGKKINEKWKNHNFKKKFHLINFTI